MLRHALQMDEPPPVPPWRKPLLATLVVTALVTACSWLLPAQYSATGVGLGFLGATWWLVLRDDEERIRHHGLALGGLFEPTPLNLRRILRESLLAFGRAFLVAVILFPPFVVGYRLYWHPTQDFILTFPPRMVDDLLNQLLVIALPEEAFFRGYLQTSLDDIWPPRWAFLGARLGPSLVVTSAIFAVGHLLTEPNPARLAVFFPSLLFGWLRSRTGGIGSSLLFHAACNLLVVMLSHGFNFHRG